MLIETPAPKQTSIETRFRIKKDLVKKFLDEGMAPEDALYKATVIMNSK